MKMRIILITLIGLSLISFNILASAMSLHSIMNVEDGMIKINYTANNNTDTIQINGSGSVVINANDSDFNYQIEESGEYTSENNADGNYAITSTLDKKEFSFSNIGILGFLICIGLIIVIILKRNKTKN